MHQKEQKNCTKSKQVVFAKTLSDGSIQISEDTNHLNILTTFPQMCKRKPTIEKPICIINNFEFFVQW